MKKKIKVPKDLGIEFLNKDQKWWRNVEDNCKATIKQFKDSIKLQEAILEMAKEKVKEYAR